MEGFSNTPCTLTTAYFPVLGSKTLAFSTTLSLTFLPPPMVLTITFSSFSPTTAGTYSSPSSLFLFSLHLLILPPLGFLSDLPCHLLIPPFSSLPLKKT